MNKEWILFMVAGIIESGGSQALAALFMKMKPVETRKAFLVSLYPQIDVELEKLAAETKTKWDDTLVAAIKKAVEMAAQETGVALPNLDAD